MEAQSGGRQLRGRGAELRERGFRDSEYERFMREVLGAFDFESSEGVVVWARPCWEDEDEPVREGVGRKISFSLLTDRMVAEDRAFFFADNREREGETPSYYRPYMFEFTVSLSADTAYGAIERLQKQVGANEWLRARLHCKPRERNAKEQCVCGDLLLSVKPYIVENLCLSFTENSGGLETPPSIPYERVTDESVIDQVRMLLHTGRGSGKGNSFTVKVHNVGQANMVYIQHNSIPGLKLYFDIGRPAGYCMPKKGSPEYGAFCKKLHDVQMSTPSFVVISHWHSDHGAAAFQLDHRVMDDAIWILPKKPPKKPPKKSSKKSSKNLPSRGWWIDNLVGYLSKRSLIIWADDDPAVALLNTLLQPCGITLDRGMGSSLNDSGLMLHLRSTILAADCNYEYWPARMLGALWSCQNLVAPHHGATIRQSVSPAFLALTLPGLGNSNGGRGSAYISVDEANNVYGHPSSSHLHALQQRWVIKRTDKLPPNRTLYEFQD